MLNDKLSLFDSEALTYIDVLSDAEVLSDSLSL